MRLRRLLKAGLFFTVVAVLGAIALFSSAVYTYSVLTDEQLIAELRFQNLAESHYRVFIDSDGGCVRREFDIYGDQWRVDAEFLKWKNWALLFGLNAQYRLSRIEGRYSIIDDQNSRRNLAHSLTPESTFDLVSIADSLGRWNFLVDTTFGSSVFQDIDSSRIYRVFRTQSGLITRSELAPEVAVGNGRLVVEVQRACGSEPGVWQRSVTWLDQRITNAL